MILVNNMKYGSVRLDEIDRTILEMLLLDSRTPLAHISKEVGREVNIPVLHLPQMVGIALGIESKELGLHHNVVQSGISK